MRKIILSVWINTIILLLFSFPEDLYSTSGCDEDCIKCHSITQSEASEILKTLKVTDAKVLNIEMSPLKGLWEVSFEREGKRGVFYIDFSKRYVVSGSIIEVKTTTNKTHERLSLAPVNYIPQYKIPLDDALVIGNKNAKKRVIIFTDPDCPFCGRLHNEIKKIAEARRDISFYIKLFPLKIHKEAYSKSKSILCEKSLRLLEDNFEGKGVPLPPRCEGKEIDENIRLASRLGISGTPTIIMPDGRVFVGFFTSERLIGLIDSK